MFAHPLSNSCNWSDRPAPGLRWRVRLQACERVEIAVTCTGESGAALVALSQRTLLRSHPPQATTSEERAL